MAEEPSTKRRQDEPSDKSSNLIDVHVPDEKREHTKTLREVELHGEETLEIVCTSEPDKADEVISRHWRKAGGMVPSVIHPFYKGMKKNINTQEDYKLWGTSPLPDNLIEYAGVDAYATYKAWSMIDYITDGSEIAKEREAANYYDQPYCPYAG
ncbi:hypothetical protein VPH35_083375 [Triticum aestivum]